MFCFLPISPAADFASSAAPPFFFATMEVASTGHLRWWWWRRCLANRQLKGNPWDVTCKNLPETTWRIVSFSKWLGSPPFISHGVRPFGRGPTTRSLGDLETMIINHLLTGMILQVTASLLECANLGGNLGGFAIEILGKPT